MALGTQVIDFIRLSLLNDSNQVAGIGQIAIVQYKIAMIDMGILIKMVHPISIERRSPSFNTVNNVAFFQEEFGKVRSVLTGDAGN